MFLLLLKTKICARCINSFLKSFKDDIERKFRFYILIAFVKVEILQNIIMQIYSFDERNDRNHRYSNMTKI